MYSNSCNGSCAAWARGLIALGAMLAMGLGLMASPAEAAPFAYVTNEYSNNVSVIDTATNPPSLVATVTLPAGSSPVAVAVTPDGKHAYVANETGLNTGAVSVIDTATNTVMATIPVGSAPGGIAITPDGKHAYVTTAGLGINSVWVIDTASNTVMATIAVGNGPGGIAITPDGKHAYVTYFTYSTICINFPICFQVPTSYIAVIDTTTNGVVATIGPPNGPFGAIAFTPDGKHAYVATNNDLSVIDTATNTVVGTPIPVGNFPFRVAVTPDGKHVYVTNQGVNNPGNVSVIDTASNTVMATVVVGFQLAGVAITPEGKYAYVANYTVDFPGTVSVIATATNAVVATVPVGNGAMGVAIVPPPPGVPFLAFGANLVLAFGGVPNQDSFALQTSFILSSTAPGINPLTEPVNLQAGTFAVTIPPGSFKVSPQGYFIFVGAINGVRLEALIEHTGTLRYALQAKAVDASFTGTQNPVYVTLSVGGDSGATSVAAEIFH